MRDIDTLVRRARAYLEYAPMRIARGDKLERIYRKVSYGPLLDVFVLDMRSYRGPNTDNLQSEQGAQTAFGVSSCAGSNASCAPRGRPGK